MCKCQRIKTGVITLIGKNRPPHGLKVYVESKADIIKRLGRSPDRGDAVVYAWNCGELGDDRAFRPRHVTAMPRPVTEYDALRY